MSLTILYVAWLTLLAPLSEPDSLPILQEPLNIGILVPDTSCKEIIQAAELAIEEANDKGGYKGQAFNLVIRTTEGPWGAGSKQSVSLVYEDNVRAIVGSLDGRNAHLAEQVAAKSHLAYLETRATDPTLSQAYVPWFFRVVPNDNQQSRAILDMIKKNGGGKTAILSSESYDARYAVKSLTKYAAMEGKHPIILSLEPGTSQSAALLEQIITEQISHLIVPFFSDAVQEILVQLAEKKPELHTYGTLAFTSGIDLQNKDLKPLEGMLLIYSFKETSNNLHPQLTGLSSVYTYDGINLIIEAIQQAGPERESIKETLLTINYQQGTSGPVTFDDMGNRNGTIRFIQILNGRAVNVN